MRDALKSILILLFLCGVITAQNGRNDACADLNGVYRIDANRSDKLYSVIENATTNIPYGEQQLFFIDLAVRLTPPDLLAIECRGKIVSLASSRAARMDFTADGITRSTRDADNRSVSSRIAFQRNTLVFSSQGGKDDLIFSFAPLDGGKSLRVTRKISARELIEPVVIQTIYHKIEELVSWSMFDNPQIIRDAQARSQDLPIEKEENNRPMRSGRNAADILRIRLDDWIDATNKRDIERQMSFYMPQLKAYYLSRNASMRAVRAEKNRVFAKAKTVDIQVAEPEIIFQSDGKTAVMRFRKKYAIGGNDGNRRGEVIQELRWQQVGDEWKIFSERDIKVLG